MKKILKIVGVIIGSVVGVIIIAIGIATLYDLHLAGYFTTNKFPNVIANKNIESKNISEFLFPAGYEKFSDDVNLNFLLNRTYSMAYARKVDMELLGKRITNRSQWKSEMIKIAEEALADNTPYMYNWKSATADNRILNAAFYFFLYVFTLK